MPNYAYIAIDGSTGREDRGSVAGDSEAAAVAELKSRGLYPTQLTPENAVEEGGESASPPRARRRRRWFGGGGSLAKTRTLFTRQMATLLKAGMPLLRGLEVLERQQTEGPFKRALGEMAATIRGGGSLSDAMTRHPKFFDALYLNMVKAGEAAGALDVVLERLAEYLEKSRKIRGQIRSAMVYPLIIMAVAVGVVSALIVFVVPKFESIFANMLKGQSLPGLTQMVLGISSLVQNQLWLLLGSGVLLVWGLRFLGRTAVGGRIRDRVSLAMPVLGDLLLKAAVARFARTLGTLLASGVQILNALQITRDTAGNVLVAGALDKVRERVRAGEGIAKPLAEQALFPEMVAGMVEVGEETGSLPDMLHRIADTYDEEVDNAVAALTSLLEPLMIVIMAVVVGVIVIALFLPLARIIQGLS
jgi:type IV pilus assembly protein PilC